MNATHSDRARRRMRFGLAVLPLAVLASLAWLQRSSRAVAPRAPVLASTSAAVAPAARLSPSEEREFQGERVAAASPNAPAPARLRLLEAGTLAPVAEATVRATDREAEERELRASAAGEVWLPSPGVWHLDISSPRHVRRELAGRIDAGELVVVLERGGSVEIDVASESGKAVEGSDVLLVPPLEGGAPGDHSSTWLLALGESEVRARFRKWVAQLRHADVLSAIPYMDPTTSEPDVRLPDGRVLAARHHESLRPDAWRARTDAAGRARWNGLPPGLGYRIAWLGPGTAELEPANEAVSFTVEKGRWAGSGGQVERVTAPLEVDPETVARATATAFRETSVHGWIDTGGASLVAPSVVRLFHRSTMSAPGAPDLALVDIETSVVPTIAGQFEIHGVRPGKKRIAAHWTQRPGEIRFASVEFEIASGESVDLGFLQAQHGYDLVVRTVLEDSAGVALDPFDVFATERAPEVALSIDTQSEGASLVGELSELVSVSLGETILLVGLPPGRTYLRARLEDDNELRRGAELRLIEPRARWVACPSSQPVEVPFLAVRIVEQRLRIPWEGGGHVPRLEAHWRAPIDELSGRLDLRPPRDASAVPEYALLLAPGRYELMLHANTLETPRRDAGWFWHGELVVTQEPATFEVRLERGAGLTGSLRDPRGQPVVRRPVSVTLPSWGTGAHATWLYKAMTDAQGNYYIGSLPPETTVLLSNRDRVVSGPRGSEQTVDLMSVR